MHRRQKAGYDTAFDENGKINPVTVIEAGPCVVVQKKTIENDGYGSRADRFWRGHKQTRKQNHFRATSLKERRC